MPHCAYGSLTEDKTASYKKGSAKNDCITKDEMHICCLLFLFHILYNIIV